VLLHGLTGFAEIWAPVARTLARDFHVLALDQRGHGDSEWAADGCYDIEAHVIDLALAARALGVDEFTLAGHSMGARNAAFFAACFPQRVQRLVLIEGRPEDEPAGTALLCRAVADMPGRMRYRSEAAAYLARLLPRLSPASLRRWSRFAVRPHVDGGYLWKYDPHIREMAREGWVLTDLWPFLESVPCPTLVVYGSESGLLDAATAGRMARVMPRARAVEVQGAGHALPLERPRAVARLLREFLAET